MKAIQLGWCIYNITIYLRFGAHNTSIESFYGIGTLARQRTNLQILSPWVFEPKPAMSRLPNCKIGLQRATNEWLVIRVIGGLEVTNVWKQSKAISLKSC